MHRHAHDNLRNFPATFTARQTCTRMHMLRNLRNFPAIFTARQKCTWMHTLTCGISQPLSKHGKMHTDAHANLRNFPATFTARQTCTRMHTLTCGIPQPVLQRGKIHMHGCTRQPEDFPGHFHNTAKMHTDAHSNLRNFPATFTAWQKCTRMHTLTCGISRSLSQHGKHAQGCTH